MQRVVESQGFVFCTDCCGAEPDEEDGAKISDYDLIEANEAFAVQALADGKALGWIGAG